MLYSGIIYVRGSCYVSRLLLDAEAKLMLIGLIWE